MRNHSTAWLALKAQPVAKAATKERDGRIRASSLPAQDQNTTGVYSFYQDASALTEGVQLQSAQTASFSSVAECMAACDKDDDCVGFLVQPNASGAAGSTCMLINADTRPDQLLQSAIRAAPGAVAVPDSLPCPSGYSTSHSVTSCAPIQQPQQLTVVLRAKGKCSDAAVEAFKRSLFKYLSNPSKVYGVNTDSLSLKAHCMSAGADDANTTATEVRRNEASASSALDGDTTGGLRCWLACCCILQCFSGGCLPH